MGRLSWPLRPLPDGRGEVWRWKLGALAELPAARSGLRGLVGAVGLSDDSEGIAAEQLILAFDELASNALRHGERPVVATVVAGSGGWLLDVSDRAPKVMPTPAVDRDPAQGGLGLHLVARLSVAH
jgi:anti-sigma regulatory factor (Ser/Thr protein kinase)